jgi:hypothetical protein
MVEHDLTSETGRERTLAVHGRRVQLFGREHASRHGELGVLKQRLPLEQHYTAEFTPVKI